MTTQAMSTSVFGREDFDGFLSGGYDCELCGAWYWRPPRLVECSGCGEELCPNCQPVECTCGQRYCRNCVVHLRDEAGEYVLCPACLRAAGLCESCGESPQEIRYLESEHEAEERVCASCALAREERATPLQRLAS